MTGTEKSNFDERGNVMKEILANQLNGNVFEIIGDDWFLITAEKEGRVNMMTASWGAFGVFWNKPCATIYVRQSRYTKEFIDASDRFSLCVFEGQYKRMLGMCGSKSGREIDKVKEADLTVCHTDGVPYFKESRLVLVCKKIYSQKMERDGFMEEEPFNKNYTNGDLHQLYIAEIEKVYVN